MKASKFFLEPRGVIVVVVVHSAAGQVQSPQLPLQQQQTAPPVAVLTQHMCFCFFVLFFYQATCALTNGKPEAMWGVFLFCLRIANVYEI